MVLETYYISVAGDTTFVVSLVTFVNDNDVCFVKAIFEIFVDASRVVTILRN